MSDETNAPSREQQIGKNLATVRGDVPQATLAERMRERGWKWSQATVWAIERGDRPLRLAEAEDVVRVLELPGGVDYYFLREDKLVALAGEEMKVARSLRTLREAAKEVRTRQWYLAMTYSSIRDREDADRGNLDVYLGRGVLEAEIERADAEWNREMGGDPERPITDLLQGDETDLLAGFPDMEP